MEHFAPLVALVLLDKKCYNTIRLAFLRCFQWTKIRNDSIKFLIQPSSSGLTSLVVAFPCVVR